MVITLVLNANVFFTYAFFLVQFAFLSREVVIFYRGVFSGEGL